jgi:simple sugar transport system ATP-binding protein
VKDQDLGGAIAAPELRLQNIAKTFGSTRALDGASLTVRAGTVHALLGENGAGKTTLMRIAFGLLQPDRGHIFVGGSPTQIHSPRDAIRVGIGMVHQHFTNVGAMTVAENIALGGRGLLSRTEAEARATELLEKAGLLLDPADQAASLSVGAQQRLEIVKAMSREASILIMDEPTAVLAPEEATELLRWLRGFANAGGSIVLITHKLTEALAIADDVTVLRFGRTVLCSGAAGTSAEQLAEAMLGSSPPGKSAQPVDPPGAVILRASSLSVRDETGRARIVDANFEVRQREIVGVAALDDSGHQLLLRTIAGRQQPASGRLELFGSVCLIPEDRLRDALIPSFSVVENLALKRAGSRSGRMGWAALRESASKLTQQFDVRAASVDAPVTSLSGGNQQKLVLARELSDSPALIVAENPTRGLDLRATADVHQRLRAAAADGAAVVVHSSDLDEVLSLATRVIAVNGGRVIEVPNNRAAAGRAMIGLPT